MDPERDTETIGVLARRLVADGKAYASAEADVYRHKALGWVPPIKRAVALGVVAIFIVQAAFTTLLVFIGFWLALWLGPLGGGVAAAAIGFAIASVLGWLAARQFPGGRA